MSLFKRKKIFKITVQEGNTGRSIAFPVTKEVHNFIINMKKPKVVGFKEGYD